MLQEH